MGVCHDAVQVLGERITNGVLRHSFFGHFCAGEDAETIKPCIHKLKAYGVGSILDYAAEADVTEAKPNVAVIADRDGVQCRS